MACVFAIGGASTCTDSSVEVLHGDVSFTPEERIEIEFGNRWMAEHVGRAPYVVAWDAPHTPEGTIPPYSTIARRNDGGAQFNGMENVYYVGVGERGERRGLEVLFAHEFGHRAGLRHVDKLGSVMDVKASALIWSEDEERQCVKRGICGSRRTR